MVLLTPLQQIQIPVGVIEFVQVKRAGKAETEIRVEFFYGLECFLVKDIKMFSIVKAVQSWRRIGQMPDTEFPLQYFIHAIAGNNMSHKSGDQAAPQVKSLWFAYKMLKGKTVRLFCQGGGHVAKL